MTELSSEQPELAGDRAAPLPKKSAAVAWAWRDSGSTRLPRKRPILSASFQAGPVPSRAGWPRDSPRLSVALPQQVPGEETIFLREFLPKPQEGGAPSQWLMCPGLNQSLRPGRGGGGGVGGERVSEDTPLLSLKGEGDKHAKHKHGKWVSSQEDILGSRKTPGDVSALRPWTRLHKAGAPRPWVTLAQDTRPYLPELLSPPRSPPAADTLWPAACPARKPTPKRG